MIEYIDNYKFYISDKAFKITSDSIDLVNFILQDNIYNEDILEIGAGNGYISTKLYRYSKNITAVEIQKEIAFEFMSNINKNKLEINCINQDILTYNKKHNIIVSNPPYYPLNSGKYPENILKKISKFEFKLNLDQLLEKLYTLLLNNNSYFYIVYPLSRKDEFINKIKKYNLEIIKLQEKGKIFCVKGKKL